MGLLMNLLQCHGELNQISHAVKKERKKETEQNRTAVPMRTVQDGAVSTGMKEAKDSVTYICDATQRAARGVMDSRTTAAN